MELRKVETLPGGGSTNTFYDLIGPGSVTLWTSGGAEYEVLHGVSHIRFLSIQSHVILHSKISHSQYAYQKQSRPVCSWNSEVRFTAPSSNNPEPYRSTAGVHYELIATLCTKGKKYGPRFYLFLPYRSSSSLALGASSGSARTPLHQPPLVLSLTNTTCILPGLFTARPKNDTFLRIAAQSCLSSAARVVMGPGIACP